MADEERVTAAVLVIGDEILSGRTQDTNTRDIARFLGGLGVDLCEVRVVPDVLAEIVAALNALRQCYDYVITTGGIGPTHDDITADAVAAAFGVELYEHPDIIELLHTQWTGEVTPARRRMARVPVGGELVKNPTRGPPGFSIGNVFVLAGVPQIMNGMLTDVGERMRRGAVTLSRTLRVDGTGEGVVAAPLEAVAKAHPQMTLGSYPFFGPEGFGTNLVLRGRDAEELARATQELLSALQAIGARATPVEPA